MRAKGPSDRVDDRRLSSEAAARWNRAAGLNQEDTQRYRLLRANPTALRGSSACGKLRVGDPACAWVRIGGSTPRASESRTRTTRVRCYRSRSPGREGSQLAAARVLIEGSIT